MGSATPGPRAPVSGLPKFAHGRQRERFVGPWHDAVCLIARRIKPCRHGPLLSAMARRTAGADELSTPRIDAYFGAKLVGGLGSRNERMSTSMSFQSQLAELSQSGSSGKQPCPSTMLASRAVQTVEQILCPLGAIYAERWHVSRERLAVVNEATAVRGLLAPEGYVQMIAPAPPLTTVRTMASTSWTSSTLAPHSSRLLRRIVRTFFVGVGRRYRAPGTARKIPGYAVTQATRMATFARRAPGLPF